MNFIWIRLYYRMRKTGMKRNYTKKLKCKGDDKQINWTLDTYIEDVCQIHTSLASSP